MMLFIPMIIGIVLGSIIYFTASILRKNDKSSAATIIGIIGSVLSIILFFIGFKCIRGFEGAAYGITAIPFFILAVISIFLKNSNTSSIYQ